MENGNAFGVYVAAFAVSFIPCTFAGHPGADGRLDSKSCAATGHQPKCAEWCDAQYTQNHCPDCACSACDFCTKQKTCEPLPDSDDTTAQECLPYCADSEKHHHCLRCDCQACSFCPHADRLANRDVQCIQGQCSLFCDPLYKQQHCAQCDCMITGLLESADEN